MHLFLIIFSHSSCHRQFPRHFKDSVFLFISVSYTTGESKTLADPAPKARSESQDPGGLGSIRWQEVMMKDPPSKSIPS